MPKAALTETGILDHATVRLPLVEAFPEHIGKLRSALACAGVAA
jgi:4-hydroxy-tetrahydrodipicolinate synthase